MGLFELSFFGEESDWGKGVTSVREGFVEKVDVFESV